MHAKQELSTVHHNPRKQSKTQADDAWDEEMKGDRRIYDADFTGIRGSGDQQAMTRRASGIGFMFTRRINGELAKL